MTDTKRNTWPYDSIEVGESFTIPADRMKPSSAASYSSRRGRDLDKRFSTRVVDGGTVVTRVE